MRVSVQGAELFYSIQGEGPDCLVLSAIGTKPYELQTRSLSDRFRFVHVALRGSGESSGKPEDLDFDVLAGDLEAVCADIGIERTMVLGHSVLGVLAIEYARRCPHRVSHVIAAGTPPRGDMQWLAAEQQRFFEEDASEERKNLLPDNLAALPPEQALLAQTPMRFFDPRFDAAPLYAAADPRPGLIYHLLGPLTSGWNVTEEAEALRVPALIAHGRYDYIVPYRLWEPVVDSLPSATLRIFRRSGHQPFFEEPDTFAEAVTAWANGRM